MVVEVGHFDGWDLVADGGMASGPVVEDLDIVSDLGPCLGHVLPGKDDGTSVPFSKRRRTTRPQRYPNTPRSYLLRDGYPSVGLLG